MKTKKKECAGCARRARDLEMGITAALNGDVAKVRAILKKYGSTLGHVKLAATGPAPADAEPDDDDAAPIEGGKTYIVKGIGAKYGGLCVACHQPTGSRPFELAQLVLLQEPEPKGSAYQEAKLSAIRAGRRPPAPRHEIAHALCVGIRLKSSGKPRDALPATVVVKPS